MLNQAKDIDRHTLRKQRRGSRGSGGGSRSVSDSGHGSGSVGASSDATSNPVMSPKLLFQSGLIGAAKMPPQQLQPPRPPSLPRQENLSWMLLAIPRSVINVK